MLIIQTVDSIIETKTCLKCKNEFNILEQDQKFYQKFSVPIPKLCPDCRQQRRLAFRNERKLYHRDCDLCGEKIISIYQQSSPLKVYCPICWYGDKWDPLAFGQDFDFDRPFFEQFAELKLKVPHISLYWRDNENSDYINMSGYNKNCYLIFAAEYNEDCIYGEQVIKSKNCIETLNCYESENCYEVVDISKCYEVFFSQNCRNCNSSMFIYDCKGCDNCLFCSNLRNKTHHVFNKQYNEEDFQKIKKELIATLNNGEYHSLMDKFVKMKKESIHKNLESQNNENSLGSFLFDSKNCTDCYDLSYGQDCRYVYTAFNAKDMMDVCHTTDAEITYEGTSIGYNSYDIKFSIGCWTSHNIEYSDTAASCSDLFGCVGMKYKKYCIFNKQYSEKEYKELKNKIIEHMGGSPASARRERETEARMGLVGSQPSEIELKNKGEYGEFFPMTLSPFCYNETVANDYYPLQKNEILNLGLNYKDREDREYLSQTYKIPSSVDDVSHNILEEILSCEICKKNYKIIPSELKFYKKYKLPIPLYCPDCRYLFKLYSRPNRRLLDRECSRCHKEIKSTYSLEHYENIFCEKCYLEKIV